MLEHDLGFDELPPHEVDQWAEGLDELPLLQSSDALNRGRFYSWLDGISLLPQVCDPDSQTAGQRVASSGQCSNAQDL